MDKTAGGSSPPPTIPTVTPSSLAGSVTLRTAGCQQLKKSRRRERERYGACHRPGVIKNLAFPSNNLIIIKTWPYGNTAGHRSSAILRWGERGLPPGTHRPEQHSAHLPSFS